MLRKIIVALGLFVSLCASAQKEAVYYINIQTFFDTDNNGMGDLKGVEQKLDYIERLGARVIMLSPVYQSDSQDNQNTLNLQAVNTEYGSLGDYKAVVQGAHKRKMKVYLKMDFNYVSPKHLWATDKSKYKNYLLEETKASENAEAIMVNLKETGVKDDTTKALKFWINPDINPSFYSGADGFVFNVQDTLGTQTGLLKDFWAPLIKEIKKVRPEMIITAHPLNDSYNDEDYFKAGFDVVVSNELQAAINSFSKAKIQTAAAALKNVPEGKNKMIFIGGSGNEKTTISVQKAKAEAALSLMLGGTPFINNGQETEAGIESIDWNNLNTQIKDKSSLWSFYRMLLFNRNTIPALSSGDFNILESSGDEVISFVKGEGKEKVVVLVNLSDKHQTITLDYGLTLRLNDLKPVMGYAENNFSKGGRTVMLEPYGVQLWRF